MDKKRNELQKDIAELELLQSQANRQKIKDVLSLELRKLTSELNKINDQILSSNTNTVGSTSGSKRYLVKLNNYAWDQSPKFVKFYVTLQKAQNLPPENISCHFTSKSLELNVRDLENKDYTLVINNLLKNINPEGSNWKVKNDMIIINAAKMEETNWSFVTETEKRASDSKKLPTSNDKIDPSEGLMSIMKNMYEQGDDEMKRTIAKAWHESQTKGPAI